MSRDFIIGLLYSAVVLVSLGRANEGPIIIEHPTDVTTVTGKDVLLRCVVENLPLENDIVQWTKGGFALGFDRDIPGFRTYSMVGDVSIGEYNLLIQNATLEDESHYECQIRVGRMRTGASVTIMVPPQGPMVEDVRSYDVIDILAYQDNLITCRSWNGKPSGVLVWYKDGVKIDSNVTYAETEATKKLRNSSATLRLWPTEIHDGERYECRMTVDSRFQNNEVSTISVQLNVQKPPIASLELSSESVQEGRNLYAKCESFASKPAASSYMWYLGGKLVEGESTSSLSIYHVNRTLNGAVIGCRAINDIGQSDISSASLNVLYAPTLVTAPTDIITNMSMIVNMSCTWDSNPPALITWYKRNNMNKAVGEGEELKIKVEDQSASGTYVCVADARGVGSKSVSARIDVLGPPIFISPSVQGISVGERAIINCTLGSTPGISHVIWTWRRRGSLMGVENNETRNHEGQVKYVGVMNYNYDTASLLIYDVSPEDLTEYNCTVHNPYGTGSVTIRVEERANPAAAMMMPIIGAVVGAVLLIIILILVVVCCISRRKQQKSTTFPPEKESLHVEYADGPNREDNRMDVVGPSVASKLVSPDADSDNPSTSASMSSRDVARASIVLEEFRTSAHNDDGYHTEEANSWNRNEKQSPDSSPARSGRNELLGGIMTSSPMGPYDHATSPYANSEVTSEVGNTGYLKYDYQPYPQHHSHYGPNGMVELPPVAPGRTMSPMHMYGMPQQYPASYYNVPHASSSGYRSGTSYPQRPRAGSNANSIVSSHRSVTPSPAYAATALGRSTPVSILGDRGIYPVPINNQVHLAIRPSSSQSSLDQPSSSIANQCPYDNAAKMSQLSSRISQASRSSELLNKPMTARMATHV